METIVGLILGVLLIALFELVVFLANREPVQVDHPFRTRSTSHRIPSGPVTFAQVQAEFGDTTASLKAYYRGGTLP